MSSQAKAGGSAGFLGLIVAVATIGGFMFGYDSGRSTARRTACAKPSSLIRRSLA
jgi:hypothetical protein